MRISGGRIVLVVELAMWLQKVIELQLLVVLHALVDVGAYQTRSLVWMSQIHSLG